MLKALLVTSRVTFVPDNYAALAEGLADCPHVGGLLVLDNRTPRLLLQALGLIATGAPRIGWTLVRNYVAGRDRERTAAYARFGKPVWRLATINRPEAVRLVTENGFDLAVNARTRFIYRHEILSAPRLGCINVHHGLLPEQRGTMCDLWALHEGRPAGFSIHVMAPKVDAGPILSRVEVSSGDERDYRAYLARSSRSEQEEVRRVLDEIERTGRVDGSPNVAPPGLKLRRNPTFAARRAMRRQGLRI